MLLYRYDSKLKVTWIASEEKFQGRCLNRNRTPIDITPVIINKYENSTLFDILKNPECQISKPNMMILKAVFEGKIKGAKVYSVPNRKIGQSILK